MVMMSLRTAMSNEERRAEATLGAMRDLDRLAAHALRETACKNRKLVERDVVTRVIEADTRERDR